MAQVTLGGIAVMHVGAGSHRPWPLPVTAPPPHVPTATVATTGPVYAPVMVPEHEMPPTVGVPVDQVPENRSLRR